MPHGLGLHLEATTRTGGVYSRTPLHAVLIILGDGRERHANTMQVRSALIWYRPTQAAEKAVSGNGNPEPHWAVMNCEPFPPALTEGIGRIARCSVCAYVPASNGSQHTLYYALSAVDRSD